MRWARWLGAGTISVLLLGACGGAAHRAQAPARAAVTATTPVAPSARAPAGFAARLLSDNELPGFRITDSAVYRTAGGLVSNEQVSPADSAAEMRMLTRTGFQVAAREDLDNGGTAGLSLVERFGSAAAARTALRFYVSEFRASGHYAAFTVSGPPGAFGFTLGEPGGAGVNIAFSRGSYYYLVGRVGSGSGPEAALIRAARSLYARSSIIP